MGTQVPSTLKELIRWKPFYFAAGFVLVIWLINLAVYFVWPGGQTDNQGIFGDIFGASNSLFSALAFAGLIIAILLQRAELEHQREELKLTRIEMEGQKKQLGLQKDQMEIQNFENRFFQMIGLWNELCSSLKHGQHEETGKRFFRNLVMPKIQQAIIMAQSTGDNLDDLLCIDAGVQSVYEGLGGEITNYMRLLYNIMKLIDRSGIDLENQKFYSNIVRAQLTQAELVVVFYNGLSELGKHRFKRLIEKYSLLKHLDQNDLVAETHASLYDSKAYA